MSSQTQMLLGAAHFPNDPRYPYSQVEVLNPRLFAFSDTARLI